MARVVTSPWPGRSGKQFAAEETHPTSYPLSTGGSFSGLKRPGFEVGHSPHPASMLRIGGAIFYSLHTSMPSVPYRGGGGLCGSNPPEIPKVLQNRVKLNPIVKTVKNC